MLACSLVTRTCLKTTRGLISGTFRRLTLEVLSPEKTIALLFENNQIFNDFTCWLVWNERMLAHWTQVSDRCPLGYLLFPLFNMFYSYFFFIKFKSCTVITNLRPFTTFQQFQNYDPVYPHCILANSANREHTLSNATLPAWVPKIGNGWKGEKSVAG